MIAKSDYLNTLNRRDLFSSVLKGLNLLVDTKLILGDKLAIQNGYRDILIKVRHHDGHFFRHIVKYMLEKLRIEYHVTNSHHYTSFKMRVCKKRIDHFSCASSIIVGYFELLSNYDLKFREKFTVSQLLTGWVCLISQMNYTLYAKLVKFMCAYPLSRMIHNDPPEAVPGYKGSPFVFSGKLSSYLRHRLICNNSKNRRLAFSILQLKRCALKMPSEFVSDALKKHRDLVSRPKVDVTQNYLELFKEKLEEILETINIPKFKSFSKIHEFSKAASFERTRQEGGASSYIHSLVSDTRLEYNEENKSNFKFPDNFEKSCYDSYQENIVSSFSEMELYNMTYTPLQGVKEWHRTYDWSSKDVFTFIEEHKDKAVNSLPDDWKTPMYPEDDITCFARVAAVEEPLKIRTVTCGQALPYNFSIGLQKDLHRSLKSLPQFSLIGEDFHDGHVRWLHEKDPLLSRTYNDIDEYANTFADHGFVSGDYTSATDTLNINLSKLILERIIFRGKAYHGWSVTYCNMIRTVIYEHCLMYPTRKDECGKKIEIDPVRQSNGQLMGSPLSFPLLCIINLIHYWIKVSPNLPLSDLPVLVNGDDILFYTSKDKYKNWSESLWEPGFQMSLGKNYFSDSIFTINTRLFSSSFSYKILGGIKREYSYEEYYPVGKLMGKSKVESPYHPRFKPTWALQPDVISGSFNECHAWSRFNVYNKDILSKVSKHGKYNYYISPYLGGLGMYLPDGVRIFTDKRKFENYKGYKTFLKEEHQRFSSFMFHYKRNWYFDPFHSFRFGVRNDFDRFNLPLSLQMRKSKLSPFSESFEPGHFTKLMMACEPHNYDEKTLTEYVGQPVEKYYNLFHSRGKTQYDDNFSFYDTGYPAHRLKYFKDLVHPDLLCRGKFEKVIKLSFFQLRKMELNQIEDFLLFLRSCARSDPDIRYYSIIHDLVRGDILPLDHSLVLELIDEPEDV